MKHRIWHKYLFGYLLLDVIVLFSLNIFLARSYREQMLSEQEHILYEEAVLISREYAKTYVEADLSLEELMQQLRTVAGYLDARIWLVNNDGVLLADTKTATVPSFRFPEADETFLDQTYVRDATFEGLTEEPFLCAVEPIFSGFSRKGYIVLGTPMREIHAAFLTEVRRYNFLAGVLLAGTGIFLGLFLLYHYRNVRRVLKMLHDYTEGTGGQVSKSAVSDEYRDIVNAIEYLSEQHAMLVDYQKSFIANVSHDFRSPLTSIKGYVEAMQDGTIPYEAQAKYLGIIQFETERLTNLTNNLLDLNNSDSRELKLEYGVFDIAKMLRQSAMTFEGKCTAKKLKIRLAFTEKEIYVYADSGKIQQVVHNLIDNAIKFSYPDSVIEVTVTESNMKVLVSVKDRGIGIPKESIGKIWERFYKTDLSRGRDKKGTGLGLSITKQIIVAHKENIRVTSTEGVGTEFTFTLAKAVPQ